MQEEVQKRYIVSKVFEGVPEEQKLALNTGEVVEIIETNESGWWKARHLLSGKIGFVHLEYIKKISDTRPIVNSPRMVKSRTLP